MKLYLAGPMTGYLHLNHPLFNAETLRLRALGYQVVNPVEINPDPAAAWSDCMRQDIAQLVSCDGVAVLPGWTGSKGASLEVYIGRALKMPILAADVLDVPVTA